LARFLIIGGNGRLGQAIIHHLHGPNTVYSPPRVLCNVTLLEQLEVYAKHCTPEIVINCAGIKPPLSETDPILSARVNTFGAGNVAHACNKLEIRLVHISTDAVFSGGWETPGIGRYIPYSENTLTGTPVNQYGTTKAIGETRVRSICPSALVIRAGFRHDGPWPYPSAFTDAYRSHMWLGQIVPEIVAAAKMMDLSGILHIGGEKKSVYEMAREVSPEVKPCLLEDFKDFPVPRDVSMDSSKWARIKRERGLV